MKLALLLSVGVLAVAGAAAAAVPTENAQSPNAAFVVNAPGPEFCWVSLGPNYYESQQYTFVETKTGQISWHCNATLVTGDPALFSKVEFDDLAWNLFGRSLSCDFTFNKKLVHWNCKEA